MKKINKTSKTWINCVECKTKADCCRLGAWIDLEEAKKILLHKIKGDFFHLEIDKSFPSGFRIGTSFEDECCTFLDTDGLCRIHKVGYHLKPHTCKEFPYENKRISSFAHVLCTPHREKVRKRKQRSRS